MNYETASMVDLQAEFVRLGNELSVIDGQRRKINAVIERRTREAAVTNRLRATTPLQREALARAIAEFKG